MNLGGACVVLVSTLVLSACGQADPTNPADVAIEPGSQAEAQKALDKAGAFVERSGTGAFLLELSANPRISIDGQWDLRMPASDYTMTIHRADDGEDVVDRTRVMEDAAFIQLSNADDPVCWMRLSSGTRALVGLDAEASLVHPAVRMLLEPHALGVVKNSSVAGHQDLRAEMAFDEAVSAAMPKAFALLNEAPPAGATVPVTVGLDEGRYSSVTYSMEDVVRAAKDNGVDLFGSAGEDRDQVTERVSHARIEIDYRSFGEETDIVAPGSDLLLGMDEFAELKPYGGTPETCAAAR